MTASHAAKAKIHADTENFPVMALTGVRLFQRNDVTDFVIHHGEPPFGFPNQYTVNRREIQALALKKM
jgi:hypothetical protein